MYTLRFNLGNIVFMIVVDVKLFEVIIVYLIDRCYCQFVL